MYVCVCVSVHMTLIYNVYSIRVDLGKKKQNNFELVYGKTYFNLAKNICFEAIQNVGN